MIRDLSADLNKYRVQGHVFTVRPTTPAAEADVAKVVSDYQAWHADAMKRTRDYGDALAAWYQSEDRTGEPPSVDTFVTDADAEKETRIYFDVFCALTTGPHSSLDPNDFDAKVAEHALWHFLPEIRRHQLIVGGFLPATVD